METATSNHEERGQRSRFLPVCVCSCGATYSENEWRALPLVGTMGDEAERLELRNCVCGSTRARVINQ